MHSQSDFLLCSDLAQRAFDRLLKMGNGSRVRVNSVMEGLGRGLAVDQTEVKGVVRELYRAGLLRYTPDRQELPASGMIEIVRPEKSILATEQEWGRVLDANTKLSLDAKEALRPLFCKVGDLSSDDMACLVDGLAGLASGGINLDDAGFNVSARTLMGGSKVITNLAPKMLQALGLPLRLQNSSPRYVVCAGPVKPEATLLIENPRAFENAVRSGLSETVALVCTYGFGLSYLGQAWRDDTHPEDKPIQIVRTGAPPSLTALLTAQRVFLWADLDMAALSIFTSLLPAIPQLRFSGIYKAMIEMAPVPERSHPYAAIFEKDGQSVRTKSTCNPVDPIVQAITTSCRARAVDQEAVPEQQIFELGRSLLTPTENCPS